MHFTSMQFLFKSSAKEDCDEFITNLRERVQNADDIGSCAAYADDEDEEVQNKNEEMSEGGTWMINNHHSIKKALIKLCSTSIRPSSLIINGQRWNEPLLVGFLAKVKLINCKLTINSCDAFYKASDATKEITDNRIYTLRHDDPK